MRRILTLLASGLLVLTACSSTTVIGQVTTTGFGGNEGAPATSVTGNQSADSEVGAPASTGLAVRGAGLGFQEEESPELVAAVPVEITQEVWCAGLGTGIRQAHQAAIDVRSMNPEGLVDAVEELHRFYRAAAASRPLVIATHITSINTALDELEPVLRPVGWDYGLIDRSAIMDADGAYGEAGMAIDRYNTDVCGLEPVGLPDDPEIESEEVVVQESLQLQDPGAPLTDVDIAFMIGQAEAIGMTREEATCFVELYSAVDTDADLTQAVLGLYDCGLDPERLEELGVFGDDGIQITSPDDLRTDEEVEAMIRSVERKGMTRAEAECHVDAYLGVVERSGDTGVALDKLLACGLTVERMEELGIFAGCPWRPNICASNN